MTRRMQIRIIALFVLLILGAVGYVAYDKLNQAPMLLLDNKFIKSVGYGQSDKTAVFEIRWKDEMKASSVKDKNNYIIEHVKQKNGKWLTIKNGKKCKIDLIQHITDQMDPEKQRKVTQISAFISPKEATEDYFRIRARNLSTKKGERMTSVEYGVVQVTSFSKFTKK